MDSDYTWMVRVPLNRPGTFSSIEEIVCGFKFWLICRTKQAAIGSMCELRLCYDCCEDCENYRLLIDYQLTPKNEENLQSVKNDPYASICKISVPNLHVQFEMIDNSSAKDSCASRSDKKEQCLTLSCDNLLKLCGKALENDFSCSIEISIKVREMLCKIEENFEAETNTRNFQILIAGRLFYIDLLYLAELDSEFFQDLLDATRKNASIRHIVEEPRIDPDEFSVFLDAVCTYRKPVVTGKNFQSTLNVSSLLNVNRALRACEFFLAQCQAVHLIRKLEISVSQGFGLLGESIVKKLCEEGRADWGHLTTLHHYMALNEENLMDQNVDVLESLGVFEDFVVI